jgi:hypothetical protein
VSRRLTQERLEWVKVILEIAVLIGYLLLAWWAVRHGG